MHKILIILILLVLSACKPQNDQQGSTEPETNKVASELTSTEPVTAIIHGIIITGNGDTPISDGLLLFQGDRIIYVGSGESVDIPPDAIIIDAQGGSVLPGFINTHIHRGFSENMLHLHLQGGVTTVRDEGTSLTSLKESLALRDSIKDDATFARLISAGAMKTVPGGYGELYVS